MGFHVKCNKLAVGGKGGWVKYVGIGVVIKSVRKECLFAPGMSST